MANPDMVLAIRIYGYSHFSKSVCTMAKFAENVFEMFRDLQSHHRFVPAWASSGSRFASLLRRETEDVFVYVFVADGRPGNADLEVSLWVAPPDCPGDQFDNLYVGYKVRIGSEYEIDDAFFSKCERRIVRFLPCVSSMVPAIRSELSNPEFRSKRWEVYGMERRTIQTFYRLADGGNPDAVAAVAATARAAKGKGKLDKLEVLFHPIAAAMIENRQLDAAAAQFFGDGIESLASSLAQMVYALELGNLSASKP